VRLAAESTPHELVVVVSGPSPDEELVSALASLKDVDYILLTNKDSHELASTLA